MTLEPWKPNPIGLDFVYIAPVVTFLVWLYTKVTSQHMTLISLVEILVITALWTVIGRFIQNRKARRGNWAQEIPGTAVDPDEPLRYDQATKDEWKRKREVHFAKSAARLEKHEAALQVEKEERKALIESLEDQLVELQNTKIEPPPIAAPASRTPPPRIEPEDIVL